MRSKVYHFGQTMALVGVYDFWVKRGVIDLMGATLPSSPNLYRAYAPSTHSLPVIAGVSTAAEVELRSCNSGIYRLSELSPLYHKIWNSRDTVTDKRRTFSVV
jgi:polynucleotide 5'-hydroxyl-kinase GRC3/NOL9